MDCEGEGLDEHVAVGRDDGDVCELDGGALDDLSTATEDLGVFGGGGGADEILLEVAGMDVGHDVEQGGDAGCVARQLSDLLVGEHDTAKGVGGAEEEAAIRHEACEC